MVTGVQTCAFDLAPEGQVAVLHAGRLTGLARQVPQPDGSVRLAPLRVIVPD